MKRFALIVMLLGLAAPAHAQDKWAERAVTSRIKGSDSAPIAVLEFADFQCPFCARFATDVFPKIDSAYVKTGKVQWVFVNIPLPNHPNAWAAAEAAMCAGAVDDKFWAMHDKIFEKQTEWSDVADAASHMARYARTAGVPGDAYQACVLGDRVAGLLIRDVLYASNSRVSGTPAFIVNNEPIFTGLKSFEEWREIIEAALKKPKN